MGCAKRECVFEPGQNAQIQIHAQSIIQGPVVQN